MVSILFVSTFQFVKYVSSWTRSQMARAENGVAFLCLIIRSGHSAHATRGQIRTLAALGEQLLMFPEFDEIFRK